VVCAGLARLDRYRSAPHQDGLSYHQALMNRHERRYARNTHPFVERVRRHIGQPTIVCPKCEKLVSPPEQLIEHYAECSRSGERLFRPSFVASVSGAIMREVKCDMSGEGLKKPRNLFQEPIGDGVVWRAHSELGRCPECGDPITLYNCRVVLAPLGFNGCAPRHERCPGGSLFE